MRLFLVSFFCFVMFSKIFAQKVEITGTVIDEITAETLPMAAVTIEISGEKISQLTNNNGQFKFTIDPANNAKMLISYLGYLNYNENISIKNNSNLGKIKLKPDPTLLETVKVLGLKPNMVASIDKMTFETKAMATTLGANATDVLKNIPSVLINAEGEISVRGSKGFLIMVNGKPSQLDAATILNQIPANSIEKVELITAPGAQYDADGKAGIINIITKKGDLDGFSYAINMGLGTPRIQEYINLNEPKRYNADLSFFYKKNKVDVNLGLNYVRNDISGQRDGDVFTIIQNKKTTFPSFGERSFKRKNYGVRLGLNYNINSKNNISFGTYYGKKEQYRRADIFYLNNKNTDINTNKTLGQASYFNSNLVLKSGEFWVNNLDYNHKFAQNSQINISSLIEYGDLGGYTNNLNINIKSSELLQQTLNPTAIPLVAFRQKIDYTQKVGEGNFQAGYQYRYQLQKGDFQYLEKIIGTNDLKIIAPFSSKTRVLNTINAFYSQYSISKTKIDYNVGLRYEQAYRSFKSFYYNPEETKTLRLNNLFPSASILYKLNDKNQLKLAYSKRVQRSTNNELNPFPEREHSETLEQGDPNILPEFIDLYELGFNKTLKKGTVFANVYFQNINNLVNRVNSVYNDSILNRIYTNVGIGLSKGVDYGWQQSIHPKFKLFVGGNVYQLSIKGSVFGQNVNKTNWVYSFTPNFDYAITSKTNVQFALNYLSERITAQGSDSRFFQPNLSLKQKLGKQWSANLQWQNMALGSMKSNHQRITTFGSNFFTTTNYIQEQNIILLNLSYSFNPKNKKAKLPASEFGEREF